MRRGLFDSIAIVGAGHAGAIAAENLRREGHEGRIVLIGGEPCLPYERPPLSKQFLAGSRTMDRMLLKSPSFYTDGRIETRLGARVESIDLKRALLHLSDGAVLAWDGLLLSTGGHPRRLQIPGADLGGIFHLRTVADAIAIGSRCKPGGRVVIVGGGYIGLEVAATCRKMQLDVIVLEAATRLMGRVVAPLLSTFYASEHAAQGVQIRCSSTVAAFVGTSDVREVVMDTGERISADLVVVGIGSLPSVDLPAAAGIHCDDGIVVDEYCRTSVPQVYAAGDCANYPSRRYRRRIRLESVENAFEQGRAAAANMAGKALVYDRVPRFWSDQYDIKLLIAGLSQGYDRIVVRGDPAERSFSVCYLRDGELIALEAINRPKDYLAAPKLIAEGACPDPDKLMDPLLPLATAMRS